MKKSTFTQKIKITLWKTFTIITLAAITTTQTTMMM